jgi:hypothetical protein
MATNSFPISLVIKAVDKATGPLKQIGQHFKQQNIGLGNAFKGVGASVANVAGRIASLGKTLALAGIGAGVAFGAMVKGAVDVGDELATVSERVGLSVDAFAQLQHAAAQADVGQEAFTASMDQFNKRLGEAKAGVGQFKQLGPLFFEQLRGAKSTEEALELASKAMAKMKTSSEQAALSNVFFGRSGLQTGQWLAKGSKQIEEWRREFEELAGPQKEFAENSSILDNELRKSSLAFIGARSAIAGALFPALTNLLQAIRPLVANNREGLRQWAEKTGDAIKKWVESGELEKLVKNIREVASIVGTAVGKIMDLCTWLGGGNGLKGALIAVGVVMSANTVIATAGLVMSLGKLAIAIGMNVAAAATWIPYLWMMRTTILASLVGTIKTAAATMIAKAPVFFAMAAPFLAISAAVLGVGAAVYQLNKHWDELKASGWGDFAAWGKDLLGFKETDEQAMRRMNNPGRALPGSSTNKSEVVITMPNAPKGPRLTSDSPNVSTDINYSMGPAMADAL